jgi:cytochrome P450
LGAAEIYPDPEVFDGFRFSKLRESEESGSAKFQVVTTSLDYLPFGHGRHACPGRFFAAVVRLFYFFSAFSLLGFSLVI